MLEAVILWYVLYILAHPQSHYGAESYAEGVNWNPEQQAIFNEAL